MKALKNIRCKMYMCWNAEEYGNIIVISPEPFLKLPIYFCKSMFIFVVETGLIEWHLQLTSWNENKKFLLLQLFTQRRIARSLLLYFVYWWPSVWSPHTWYCVQQSVSDQIMINNVTLAGHSNSSFRRRSRSQREGG